MFTLLGKVYLMSESLIKMESNMHGHPKFYELLNKMASIHSAKNHDYSGEEEPLKNFKASLRIGIEPWIACVCRMQDKFSRIENFTEKKMLEVKDETFQDTLVDLANYCLLCLILFEDGRANQLTNEFENAEKEIQPEPDVCDKSIPKPNDYETPMVEEIYELTRNPGEIEPDVRWDEPRGESPNKHYTGQPNDYKDVLIGGVDLTEEYVPPNNTQDIKPTSQKFEHGVPHKYKNMVIGGVDLNPSMPATDSSSDTKHIKVQK